MHQWPRVRARESSKAEGAEEAHKAQKSHKQKKGRDGKATKGTTGHRDRAATKGGGAGKAEEDRAEKAAHITLE